MVLETERLLVRHFNEKDANDLYEYLSLKETYIYEPGSPISLKEAKKVCIERASGNNFFSVIHKQTEKMIGHLYFNKTQPEDFLTWELGFIFNPIYHNKGYCTEASEGILRYAFVELQAHRIIAFCNPMNVSSWRVLEKIGMKKEGCFKEKAFFRRDTTNSPQWHDCLAYGLIERDYLEDQKSGPTIALT